MAGYWRSQAAAATSTFAAGAVRRDGGHILQGAQARHGAPNAHAAVSTAVSSLVSAPRCGRSSSRSVPRLGGRFAHLDRAWEKLTKMLSAVSPLCADLLRAGLRATRCPELDVERTDASEKKPDLAMHHAPTLPNYGRVAEFLAPCSNVLSKNGLIVRDAPESHVSVSCAANMAAYGDDSSRSACQCHSAVYTFHQDARSRAADPPSLSSHP